MLIWDKTRTTIDELLEAVEMTYKKGVFGSRIEKKLREAFLDTTGACNGDPLTANQIPEVIQAMKDVKQDEVTQQGNLSGHPGTFGIQPFQRHGFLP